MKAWALRDKGTKLCLPWGKHNRHNSWEEFTSENKPRLFNSKRAASNAKIAWMQGKWRIYTSYNSFEYGESSVEPKFIKERKEKEIEIVEFDLTEKEA